jgi:hypothetical protein
MEKKQGSQVLRDLQTMCHNRSDEGVDELIGELRTYLAQFPESPAHEPPEEPELDEEVGPARAVRGKGRNRMERGGRNRGE